MQKVGLDRLDIMMVFRKTLGCKMDEDDLIRSIAQAVGASIEENNKKLIADFRSLQKGTK